MAEGLKFIRKDGRIIPIHDGGNVSAKSHPLTAVKDHYKNHPITKLAGKAQEAGVNIKHQVEAGLEHVGLVKQPIKVHAGLDALGLGLSVASGVVGAATFGGSAKRFVGGVLGSHALDAVGIAANAAGVAGKGQRKERAKQFAKNETRNLILGNAVYAAGLLALKDNRKRIVAGAITVASKIKSFYK